MTHTIAAWAQRDLSEFELGAGADADTFDFVPDSSATLQFGPEPRMEGEIRRHAGLAGVAARWLEGDLRVTADFEASPGDRTFFRTGLMDYQRGKLRARYRLNPSLSLQASFVAFHNRNSDPQIDFDLDSRQSSASLVWTPPDQRFSVLADYTRSTIRSEIQMIQLPFFGTDVARYRDQGHSAGLFVETELPRQARLRMGGGWATNSGSRPTSFYQPQVSISSPLYKRADWIAEWRWYGFDEDLLHRESFRTHTFSAGLRLNLFPEM